MNSYRESVPMRRARQRHNQPYGRHVMKTKRAMVIAAALMAATTLGAQPTGQAIMESVYNRPTGNDIQSDLTMTLINSRGDTRERQIRQFIKEYYSEEYLKESAAKALENADRPAASSASAS